MPPELQQYQQENESFSTSGDHQLGETTVNVKYIAVENCENYKNCYVQNEILDCKILHPIFTTLEERTQSEMIENKTKTEIIIEINALFDKIPKKLKYKKYIMPYVKNKSK